MECRALITTIVLLMVALVFLNRNTISGLALAESNKLYPVGDVFPLGVYDAHGQFFALDKLPIQPKEAYHDSYLGIVSGAKAIVLYSYSRGISECPKETWGAYKKVADEISGRGNLGPIILSADVPQKIKVEVIDGPKMAPEVKNQMYPSVNWLEKHFEGHVYLFVVNSAVEEVTVKISDLPTKASKAEVLFQNRSVDITDGSFTEKLEQYDVNIYKMPGGR